MAKAAKVEEMKAPRVRKGEPKRLALTLKEMRTAAGVTQVELAERLGTDQAEVSRLERRDDAYLSTLERYGKALGAAVEVVFVFPAGHRIVLAREGDGTKS